MGQQQARALSRTASLASQQVDYYAVMFVPKTAKQREIREAYNTLAKVYDPKRHKENAKKLQLVEEAYAILSNVSLRRLFDQGKCGAVSVDSPDLALEDGPHPDSALNGLDCKQ